MHFNIMKGFEVHLAYYEAEGLAAGREYIVKVDRSMDT